jgi:hypothetical protein
VTLTNLPAGFVLGVGDYIGYRYTATDAGVAGLTWHALTRVVAGATASGAGAVTVTCEPPIPGAVPNTAVAYLDTPKCVMVLIGDQSSLDAIDRREAIRGGQLAAVQDLRG